MDQLALLQRCQSIAAQSGSASSPQSHASPCDSNTLTWGPEDAIGFFQALRPHGERLEAVFENVPHGDELQWRLTQLYQLAGDPKRPDGAKDAYFVVRKPVRMSPEIIEHAGKTWLKQMALLDSKIGDGKLASLTNSNPEIRVLEGQPPKHPKKTEERCELLNLLLSFSQRCIEPLEPPNGAAIALRRAYYFIACDAALCEYLIWPVYRDITTADDPFEPYFTLWKAGVKFRIFNNESVDFYMPRAVS